MKSRTCGHSHLKSSIICQNCRRTESSSSKKAETKSPFLLSVKSGYQYDQRRGFLNRFSSYLSTPQYLLRHFIWNCIRCCKQCAVAKAMEAPQCRAVRVLFEFREQGCWINQIQSMASQDVIHNPCFEWRV